MNSSSPITEFQLVRGRHPLRGRQLIELFESVERGLQLTLFENLLLESKNYLAHSGCFVCEFEADGVSRQNREHSREH